MTTDPEPAAPTEAETRQFEAWVAAEVRRAARLAGLANSQTGDIRKASVSRAKRKAAKAARKRNR